MHPEQRIEDLLLRIVPQLATQWAGATPQEIEAIELRAGRPLPPFYLWFLAKMGASMGPASFGRIDFRAQTVLSVTLPDEAQGRFVLIGHQTDPMTYYRCYDLDYPNRDDARVVIVDNDGELISTSSETFRELIALSMLRLWRVTAAPQQCEGWLSVDAPHVLPDLAIVMESLGFTTPIQTGLCCGLFENGETTLVSKTRDPSAPVGVEYFSMGAPDAATIRQILGRVATESRVKVEVDSWTPQLPSQP